MRRAICKFATAERLCDAWLLEGLVAPSNQPYIVPVYFAYESDRLYGFATFGQKIDWMRSNPRVCVQTDEVLSNDNWSAL